MDDIGAKIFDNRVRAAAFGWLSEQVKHHGDVIPRQVLQNGFEFQNRRVPLMGPQGIFKPKIFPEIPLSITTAPKGPYDDNFGSDGMLMYKYRGTNPAHHENVSLRKAYLHRSPLIYFHGVVPGKYLAAWPVYIMEDLPKQLTFKVAVDDVAYALAENELPSRALRDSDTAARRRYITSLVRSRLHQSGFRERVLAAYKDQCALCRLKHRELLDAAHIIPDSDEGGEPTVRNGIAMCKLHHAAFDKFFLGIRPDYVIVIRKDVLNEIDGPILRHGLQGLHNSKLILPKKPESRPDPTLLSKRWNEFRAES